MASCSSVQVWWVGRGLLWGDATATAHPFTGSKRSVLAASTLFRWSLCWKLAPLTIARRDGLWEGAPAIAFGKRKASLVSDGLQASVSALFRIEGNQRCLFMTLFIGNKFAWRSKHTQLIVSACMFSTRKTKCFLEIHWLLYQAQSTCGSFTCHHPPFWLDFSPCAWLLGNKLPPFASLQLNWFPRPSCTFIKLFFLYVFVATLFCFSACYPRERNVHGVQGKEKEGQNQ